MNNDETQPISEAETSPETTETGGIQVVSPIDPREMTRIETDKGNINVIHEITLGDLLLCTLIAAMLIFSVISRLVRR